MMLHNCCSGTALRQTFELVQALVPGSLHGIVLSLHEAIYRLYMHFLSFNAS